MENKNLTYGLMGLLAGMVLTWIFASAAVNNQNYGMMRMMGMRNMMDGGNYYDDSDMHGAMGGMMSGLLGKTGDDFDKAFLSEMIVHHEGAVNMATAALSNAKHQELKDLARAIIEAQTKEMGQMRSWQEAWYK